MNLMQELRKKTNIEEIDYLFVIDALSSYRHPRDKLTDLLKSKSLIRVKKGLYVFGKDFRLRPYSLEVLANLIYGPSYISLEYALSYYGMIPERVSRVTSVSFKRHKNFKTPVGEFNYEYLNEKKFCVGITWESIDENTHFFIATKEKALADFIAKEKKFNDSEELYLYLIEGMRIDESDLKALRLSEMENIAAQYQNRNVEILCQILRK